MAIHRSPRSSRSRSGISGRSRWLYAARRRAAAPGYRLWRKTGSPIILVRDRDGEIRAFWQHLPPPRRAAGRRTPARPRDSSPLPRLVKRPDRSAARGARRSATSPTWTSAASRSTPCAASASAISCSSTGPRRAAAARVAVADTRAPREPAVRQHPPSRLELRDRLQREDPARCVPRDLSPEVDPPADGGPFPRLRGTHAVLSAQRQFDDVSRRTAARTGGPRGDRDAGGVDGRVDLRAQNPSFLFCPNLVTPPSATGCADDHVLAPTGAQHGRRRATGSRLTPRAMSCGRRACRTSSASSRKTCSSRRDPGVGRDRPASAACTLNYRNAGSTTGTRNSIVASARERPGDLRCARCSIPARRGSSPVIRSQQPPAVRRRSPTYQDYLAPRAVPGSCASSRRPTSATPAAAARYTSQAFLRSRGGADVAARLADGLPRGRKSRRPATPASMTSSASRSW